jgi:hypothetical protein
MIEVFLKLRGINTVTNGVMKEGKPNEVLREDGRTVPFNDEPFYTLEDADGKNVAAVNLIRTQISERTPSPWNKHQT